MVRSSESEEVKRRTVLRNVTAVGIASVGASVPASGVSVHDETPRAYVERRFGDRDTIVAEFERTGRQVVDTLSEQAFLDDVPTDELGPFVPFPEYQNDDRHGVLSVSPVKIGDTIATDVQVQLQADGQRVVVHLQPERDKQFAIVDPDGADVVVDPDSGTVSESTRGTPGGFEDVATMANCDHCYGEDNNEGGCDYRYDYWCSNERCDCNYFSTDYWMYQQECRCCCALDDNWVCTTEKWVCGCSDYNGKCCTTNEWCV